MAIEEPQVMHWFGKMLLHRGRSEDESRAGELPDEGLAGYRSLRMPLNFAPAGPVAR